ncbi:hypothetical protein D9M69_498920 [compost metagenome]
MLNQCQHGVADQPGSGLEGLGEQADQVGDQGLRRAAGEALADTCKQRAVVVRIVEQFDEITAQLFGGSVGGGQLCRVTQG